MKGHLVTHPSVVDAGIEINDLALILQQGYAWQEAFALQAVLVQIFGLAGGGELTVGRPVGGRHDGDAVAEQLREQASQNHCVGNVCDLSTSVTTATCQARE